MTQEEYAEMLSQAKEQFKSGTPLFGKDGAFHRVLEDFLNAAMEGEMDSHLQSGKTSGSSNRRNGKMPKRVQTEYGPVEVETPRDRDGTFSPETIRKRETILAEGLSDKIISLYATGQSVRDISRLPGGELRQPHQRRDHQQHHRQGVAGDKGMAQPHA